MVLEESAGSQWAGLSTRYSHSPNTYSIGADLSPQASRIAQTSSMAAASAYGLYEIPPFEQLARINHGARAPATTPTIAHVVPRANFDTFTASLLTVLQILTLTDWQHVLYDAARTSGSIIAFYFYLLLFMGTSCQRPSPAPGLPRLLHACARSHARRHEHARAQSQGALWGQKTG